MNTLLREKARIFDVKEQVATNSRGIYAHSRIGSGDLSAGTISIVMTSCNRSAQVYYTLTTIARSAYKNVQVILVDDSTHDPVLAERLTAFPFVIDFIRINRAVKCWHNPVVNYNIGFKFIEGGKVIVQNAEVCHVGDVLTHVSTLPKNTYAAYDVRTSRNFDANAEIYKMDKITTAVLLSNTLMENWYQSRERDMKFHFLVAMDYEAFKKVGGFSYDYSFGCDYDDNDFVMRVQARGIEMISYHYDTVGCGGIHLYHGWSSIWNRGVENNKVLFDAKTAFYKTHAEYLDITECVDTFDLKYSLLT